METGSTWNASSHGTGTNPDSKLLLPRHAFKKLGCPAVEYRTRWLNHQSREAIARLDAKPDGCCATIRGPGTECSGTPVFSILEHDWPMVRAGLEHRFSKQR